MPQGEKGSLAKKALLLDPRKVSELRRLLKAETARPKASVPLSTVLWQSGGPGRIAAVRLGRRQARTSSSLKRATITAKAVATADRAVHAVASKERKVILRGNPSYAVST